MPAEQYNLFTKITLTCISETLDEAHPLGQPGFRKGLAAWITSKRFRGLSGFEHRPPLVLFFDYEKAFDSVETHAILSALVYQ
ncbi:unnamed protein product, partial [Strongylus vulgaris]